MTKKILTYNVNGIRAAVNKGFIQWLSDSNADIVCIQETKAQIDQIPINDFAQIGYRSYCFSAQKKGYSGVAILCKDEPDRVIAGLGIEKYDYEGRFIRADFGDNTVISVYHPSGTSGDERQAFKMQWLEDFKTYILELRKTRKNLIIAGDYNICHRAIDIHDPIRNAKSSGFLPEERVWIGDFIDSGFIDSFRFLHKEEANNYTWWSYRAGARAKNLGWRIDYLMISENLKNNLKNSFILPDAMHSDHCPTGIDIGGF